MARDTYAYRHVAVESRDIGGAVEIRPVPGQAFSPELAVQCSRRLVDLQRYRLGSRFLLFAKLTDRLGGTPYLYAWHGDPDVPMTPADVKKFLGEFRRGRI
ncbi:hypothetical protein [Janthinobacterium sp. PC23-8]|uniref:hypothetical protein n=1 Tax=Janthinobacterium sp. PC23-8 TaxID=2012679 RepID=UPI000B95DCAE|nr:hypothetical protein [Janthinobacterium sp. PC23-8]OYO30047.1 hypothetical protein CD932_02020 [Janthinobacterium sp. PC23-8]